MDDDRRVHEGAGLALEHQRRRAGRSYRRAPLRHGRRRGRAQGYGEEIHKMQQLVRQGMEAGAVGFSTNQNPRHIREDRKPVASRLGVG